jgi:hypothetical protein
MTVAPPTHRDDDAWLSGLAEVHEHLARQKTSAEAHERDNAKRHGQVIAVFQRLPSRLKNVDSRAWKLALALALGAEGMAGGAELDRNPIGD